jgi:hypothetical protein
MDFENLVEQERPWRQEILGTFVGPTMEEKRALALQARYEMDCDQFDDNFLTGKRYGESYPANEVQHRMMLDHARSRLKQLWDEAKFWGVKPEHLRRARVDLMRYRKEQIAETYDRFKHTLDKEGYSQR